MKILIVDDNPINRELLRTMLEKEKLTVVEAENGVAALKVLEREKIKAIISDVLMPQMDGYRFCHEVRKSDRFATLPFIIYTSTFSSPGDEKLALELGADRFILKPASAQVICDVLRELLEGRIRFTPTKRDPDTEVGILKQYGERLVAKLEQRNIELQVSEERYRTLAETAQDLIFTADHTGVVQYINPYGARLIGRTVLEVIGKSQEELFAPEVAQKRLAALQKVFASGKPLYLEARSFVQAREMWEGVWLAPIKDAAGRVTSVMGISRDVTDRRQAEQLRSSLSLSFSHELNTPLTGILGFVDAIRSDFDTLSREQLREMVEMIDGSAKRLQALVERNLDFAEVEMLAAGADNVETLHGEVTEDAGTFARNLAEQIARNHQRRGDLKLDLASGSAPLSPRFLTRLLAELLDNAFKFSSAGSPVHVTSRLGTERFQLSVQDTGRGMTPEEIASIGAFVQFDRERQEQQGVGLGLYLARRIAEMHGGSLKVDGVAGHGTTVTLRLP